MPEELTDAQLVDLLRSDRTAGFDLLYRRYAQRLFAYSVTVVQDRAAAEDATHESLMAAVAKIDKLRDPEQLRSWLFAITRNRCLSVATERGRFTDAQDVLDMIPVDEDPTTGLAQQDSAALVTAALAGLAPADRDTLALALRHDLDMADVALAMGSNQPTARARISRAKAALTGSVTGLLLARDATDSAAPDCAGLREALAGFTGEWTPLIRKRVAKHAKSCTQCDERGHQRAVQYVSAFTLPVVLVLAPQARARADEGLATLDTDGAGDWLTWRPDGFPQAVGDSGRRLGRGLVIAGVAGLALLLTGLVTWQVNAEPPVPVPSTPTASPSMTPSPTPTPSRSESPTAKQKDTSQRKNDQGSPSPTNAADPTPTSDSQPPATKTPKDPTPQEAAPEEPEPKDPTPKPSRDEPDPTKDPKEPTQEPAPEPEPEPTRDTGPTKDPAPEPEPEPEPEPTKGTEPRPQPEPIRTKGTPDIGPSTIERSDRQDPVIQ